ncbi:Cyclophilin-like domain [Propionibacterium ruminifibrarum]|uniref:Cyclophilin-like domain n=1 Tax=Propionibacterium ruminifibrarum TaxID=1962131 RepID=A0A375I4L9_9ACTN|nr:cyclophilin-like fold protein [Propionibacterium ruminifibrarum]SPF68295.1 Cyclophilin-like domain [Propionibacterium ruminifibrarum]
MLNRIALSRRGFAALLTGAASATLVASAGCGRGSGGADDAPAAGQSSPTGSSTARHDEEDGMLTLSIDGRDVDVAWEDNETVRALADAAADEPVTVQMSRYGGFEQVGGLGFDLPHDDERITTEAGDIVLYTGDQIVVFYGSNTWEYTRLGRIRGMSDDELGALLGSGDVRMTFSVS